MHVPNLLITLAVLRAHVQIQVNGSNLKPVKMDVDEPVMHIIGYHIGCCCN